MIFSTPHGSVLYGLNHAGSDEDMMLVYDDKRKARQRFNGNEDFTTVGLSHFLDLAQGGAHQYLEALYSPVKEWHNEAYLPMIESVVVPVASVRNKYMRTIKHFALNGDTMKRRRHCIRLAYALHDMTAHGKFNPRLDQGSADAATLIAKTIREPQVLYEIARDYAMGVSEWELATCRSI